MSYELYIRSEATLTYYLFLITYYFLKARGFYYEKIYLLECQRLASLRQ